jgi:putative transposase
MPSVTHSTRQYENNRAEVSHQPTRQRERQSPAHLQRFASVHGVVQNLFRVGRHLLRSAHHQLLRTQAFLAWDAATCAC